MTSHANDNTRGGDIRAPDTEARSPARLGRRFMVVWFGQLASSTGSALMAFALGVWAFQQTGSVLSYSLAVVFGTAPRILLAPWVGRVIDRSDARKVMLIAEVASGLCAVALTAALMQDRLLIWHVYALNVLAAVCLVFQSVAYQVLVPDMVPKDKLARANGLIQLGTGISQLAAPVAAGALMGAIGLVGVATIDMVSFGIAVCTLVFVGGTIRSAAMRTVPDTQSGPVPGQSFLKGHRSMSVMMGYVTVQHFLIGLVLILVSPIVLMAHSSLVLGSLLTFGGFGLLAGALLMTLLPSTRLIPLILGVGSMLGLIVAAAGWTTSLPVLYLCAFLIMVCASLIGSADQTLWQRKVPAGQRGRVFALRQALMAGTGPIAALAAGILSDRYFTPWLMPDGALAASIGPWFGVGPGRGAGLLVVVVGGLYTVIALAALLNSRIRNLERVVPDAE